MARPAKFTEARILDAAQSIVARQGPNAATIGAIGNLLSAPSGSIYHRYRTRDELLGALWIRTATRFQDAFAQKAQHPDAVQAGLQAGLSMLHLARDNLENSRIMLLYRREDFLSGNWPAELEQEAERLGAQIKDVLRDLARRLFGRASADNLQATMFAAVDIPFAATRRFVAVGQRPPIQVDDLVAGAYRGAVEAHRRKLKH
jgi:AcrR family transcriptional regulator